MKIFVDLEFLDNGKTIDIISLGAVAEDGREFYAESSEFNWNNPEEDLTWLNENVKPHLAHLKTSPDKDGWNAFIRDGGVGGLMPIKEMAWDFFRFATSDGKKPEFWGYYCDYDWVAIARMYGRMIDLPKEFPMYCRDLKQELDRINLRVPKQEGAEHHALADARWIKQAYELATTTALPTHTEADAEAKGGE